VECIFIAFSSVVFSPMEFYKLIHEHEVVFLPACYYIWKCSDAHYCLVGIGFCV